MFMNATFLESRTTVSCLFSRLLESPELIAPCTHRTSPTERLNLIAGRSPAAYDDPYALIGDPDVDLVAVVTPSPGHAPLVRAAIEAGNYTHVLSVYGGHFLDVLFRLVGPPKDLTALTATQFPEIALAESGKTVTSVKPDQVMALGTLTNGGLFSVQLEGGQKFPTGLQIDITGTEGVLRVTNDRAFENTEDNTLHGVNTDSDEPALAALDVPAKYRSLPDSSLDESVKDLAHLYAAFARDEANGTTEATCFTDAVNQHRLIDRIQQSSEASPA